MMISRMLCSLYFVEIFFGFIRLIQMFYSKCMGGIIATDNKNIGPGPLINNNNNLVTHVCVVITLTYIWIFYLFYQKAH